MLWIGGALLLLLLALDGLMPPTAFSHASAEVRFPPIRIRSDLKGPEAVVIDTSQVMRRPIPDHDIAAAEPVTPSRPESDADQAQPFTTLQGTAADHSTLTSQPAPAAREAFAQLDRPDQSGNRKPARPVSATRRHAQRRIEASRQHAERLRHLACDWCGPSSPGQAY
jgi:hypothetical protein